MITVYKSVKLWRHVPSLYELQNVIDPDMDIVCSTFEDETSLDTYFRCTGIRIFTNGADPSLATGKTSRFYLRSEYKYYKDGSGEVHFYPLVIPDQSEYILI